MEERSYPRVPSPFIVHGAPTMNVPQNTKKHLQRLGKSVDWP